VSATSPPGTASLYLGSGSRRAQVLAIVALAVYLAASWFPFRLDPPRSVPNGLSIDGGVWLFEGIGMARTDGPPTWLAEVTLTEAVEFHLEVRPASVTATGPARILALSAPAAGGRDVREQNLVIGQDGTDLIVRLRRPGADRNGQPPIVMRDVLDAGTWRGIHVVLGSSATVVVDEGDRVSIPARGWADTWDEQFVLTIGNTPSGFRPWQGEVRVATVASQGDERDLLRDPDVTTPDEVLLVPPRLRREGDRPPVERGMTALLHVIGGALGALMVRVAWPRWSALRVVALIGSLSLVVNVMKVVIATRHPSVMTVLLQVLGALAMLLMSSTVSTRRVRRNAGPSLDGLREVG
jgi:hypothetical protein